MTKRKEEKADVEPTGRGSKGMPGEIDGAKTSLGLCVQHSSQLSPRPLQLHP
jgi:hypothetical protein